MKKVAAGDPIGQPSAADHNAIVDAVEAVRRIGESRASAKSTRSSGIVRVFNAGDDDFEQHEVVGLEGPLVTPEDDEDAFLAAPQFSVVAADRATHSRKFGILLTPLAAGDVGKACLSGVTVALINVSDESHEFADLPEESEESGTEGAENALVSAGDGPVEILWKEEGTGLKRAYVRIPKDTAIRAIELKETLMPGESATGWVVTWDDDAMDYTAADYESDTVEVYDADSAYFGIGHDDASGETGGSATEEESGSIGGTDARGDIVFVNEQGVVVGGVYPIVQAILQGDLSPHGSAQAQIIKGGGDEDPKPVTIEVVDAIGIMGPQVDPGVNPLQLRDLAVSGTYLEARWSKHDKQWEIISLGDDGSEPESSASPSPSPSGSSKSTAIVPASWTKTGYAALFVTEAPGVWFEDFAVVTCKAKVMDVKIDPHFIEVCDPKTFMVLASNEMPFPVGASVDAKAVHVLLSRNPPKGGVKITLHLIGARRGFSGVRFPERTRRQFMANERFLRSAYGNV